MPIVIPETEVRYEPPKWTRYMEFPINSFPPIMRDAIREVIDALGAPVSLVANTALGAVSLACQNYVNVQCPKFGPASCALFLWTIAESSKGKSEVVRRFFRSVVEFEKHEQRNVEARKPEFNVDLKCWQDDEKKLEKEYRKAQSPGEKERLREQRREHARTKPPEPRARVLHYAKSTPQKLSEALDQLGAVGIISPEAGGEVNGETFGETTLLNKYWSGESDRAGLISGDRVPEDPRLTISVMLQESEFSKFMQSRRGKAASGNGFLARLLIAHPPSLWGSESDDVDEQCLDRFNARVASILRQTVPPREERAVLVLSEDAKRYWRCYRDAMTKAAGDLRRTEKEKYFLLKLAQHASRIAALFHYFSRAEIVEPAGGDSPSALVAETQFTASIALISAVPSQFRRDVNAHDSGAQILPVQPQTGNSHSNDSERLQSQSKAAIEDKLAVESLESTALTESVSESEIVDKSTGISAAQIEGVLEAAECPNAQISIEKDIGLGAIVARSSNEISGETMLAAINLCEWFDYEYRRVMGRQEPAEQATWAAESQGANNNREKLLRWIYNNYERLAQETNSECVKLGYVKFQNVFPRMGKGNIHDAMDWVGRQSGFRIGFGPRSGKYLCVNPSDNFCYGCESANARVQSNFSGDQVAPFARGNYAEGSPLVNDNPVSVGLQNSTSVAGGKLGHDAAPSVDSREVVLQTRAGADCNPGQAKQGVKVDLERWHERLRDAAADGLTD